MTQSETSTGVVADVQALSAAAGDALVVCDAISSLGAIPLETDAWGVDVVVSGSQKALMTPPGLAAVSVSDTAWKRSEKATLPRYYFDWGRVRKAQAKFDAVFTPAVSLVGGLNVALGLIVDEGLEAAFDRHLRLGRACREGIKAMGLELFSPDEDRSAVVTAVSVPDEIDSDELWPRCVTASGSRSPPDRDRSRAGSSASATSATTTSSTSRPRLRVSSSRSRRWAPRSSAASRSGTPWKFSSTPTV